MWFLWPPSLAKCGPEIATKCGCSGGCRFFGTNEAAQSFFKPSKEEIELRLNVAIPTIRDRRQKPGNLSFWTRLFSIAVKINNDFISNSLWTKYTSRVTFDD